MQDNRQITKYKIKRTKGKENSFWSRKKAKRIRTIKEHIALIWLKNKKDNTILNK